MSSQTSVVDCGCATSDWLAWGPGHVPMRDSASPRFTVATSCVHRGIWGLTILRIPNPRARHQGRRWRTGGLCRENQMLWVFPSSSKRKPLRAMAGRNMKEAKEQGADFMVTPCLCAHESGYYQDRAGRALKPRAPLTDLACAAVTWSGDGASGQGLGALASCDSVGSILATLERHRTRPQPS